jgi:hypothetical protein
MPHPTDRRTFLKATLATGLYGLARSSAPAAASPGADWVDAVRAELRTAVAISRPAPSASRRGA